MILTTKSENYEKGIPLGLPNHGISFILIFSTMLVTRIPSLRSAALWSSKVGIGDRSTYLDFLRPESYRSAATCKPYMTMSN